jgi:hypothetical protein
VSEAAFAKSALLESRLKSSRSRSVPISRHLVTKSSTDEMRVWGDSRMGYRPRAHTLSQPMAVI